MNASQYSPKVRVGNWFEDICLELEKMKSFRYQRDSGALLIEKTRELFENFHQEIELEAPKDNIRFGAIVQLMPARMNICEETVANVYPALSVIINERVVRNSQEINDDCELTIAPSTKPCVRNSFRIVSADDKDRTGEVLKYGQHFRLECVGTKNDQLLVCSTAKSADLTSILSATFESRKFGEYNLVAGLCWSKRCGPGTLIPSAYTHWFCQNLNPKKRFETDGTTLPSNTPLVITHVATNRNLAAENVIIQTLFGPEFLVSVQTYKDNFKRETWQNIWMICNGHQTAADV